MRLTVFRMLLFFAGLLSVGSLVLYFLGAGTFSEFDLALSAIEVVSLVALAVWAWLSDSARAALLLYSGLWAGLLATLAYDLVRVPAVHGGVPVFKAISYFGTILLGQDRPTVLSEILGWAYHLSNGVSFALMYVALGGLKGSGTAKVVTGVLWGLSLEGAMLLTPYAEVLGYQRDARFVTITIGSHVVYGVVIGLSLHYYRRFPAGRPRWIALAAFLVPAALAMIAIDFNRQYSKKIPLSPPAYIGRHLYVVWNVPEPDRIAAIWLTQPSQLNPISGKD